MRYYVLAVLLFISFPISAQNDPATQQALSQDKGVLVRDIVMEGFVLPDKSQFTKLFKFYRNKHLIATDMDAILLQLEEIYEQAGYQGLVSIEYSIKKSRLTFTVTLIK